MFLAWMACFGVRAQPAKLDRDNGTAVNLKLVTPDGDTALQTPGYALVNPGENGALANTYFGARAYPVNGLVEGGHTVFSAQTQAWSESSCVLGVVANPQTTAGTLISGPAGGCGMGPFWDMGYRAAYGGEDTQAATFSINGVPPVAHDAAVASFGSVKVTNFADQTQTIGYITLAQALTATQAESVNKAHYPMRIQLNNNYFGYTIPNGLKTVGGAELTPVDADLKTVYVDNWTRPIETGFLQPVNTAGGSASSPTFDYVSLANHVFPGTGIMPNTVGLSNGSAPFKTYTVTIDGVSLVDVMYNAYHISDKDVVDAANQLETVSINNKTGKSTWDDSNVFSDSLAGHAAHYWGWFAGCQNDDNTGNGTCGATLLAVGGWKRVVVCGNAQVNIDEGPTDCMLDTGSTRGYHVTKTGGYALFLDPGGTGQHLSLLDTYGNMGLSGEMTAASVSSQSFVKEGVTALARAIPCDAGSIGAHYFFPAGRKPGEAPEQGSGVLGICERLVRNGAPTWARVRDDKRLTE